MTNEPSGKTLIQQKMIQHINDPDQATKGFVVVGVTGQGISFDGQEPDNKVVLNDPSPEFIQQDDEEAVATKANLRVWTILDELPSVMPPVLKK